MAEQLVIVESPAKARTIGRFLGREYSIKASLGHIRDLPKSKLGVDIDNGFTPEYTIPKGKKKVIQELRNAAKGTSSIYLATDPDREGEAISWHLIKAIPLDENQVYRVIFHEITEEAIKSAFRHPGKVDMNKVYAQQARRILDRLVGYKISPLLWQKVKRGLSAGRVQSVALQMIVERERAIDNFTSTEYWTIEAELAKLAPITGEATPQEFRAKLIGFTDRKKKLELSNQEEAEGIMNELREAHYSVTGIEKKKVLRQPRPPLITSTLQQEAWHKLHFTAQRTMRIAQQLYEGLTIGEEEVTGLITYMRTDSTRVSPAAISETRDYIAEKYGANFVPPSPRRFVKKARGAQEAHEAIRPTSIRREPAYLKPYLTRDQLNVYQLIWRRMVASQMSAASFNTTTVDITAKPPDTGKAYLLRASSSVNEFKGFLVLSGEERDEDTEDKEIMLPELSKNESLVLKGLIPEQHFTQPPPRYTEATLIKALEENGIGRPSTYAPILSAIQEREYVQKTDGRLHPREIGIIVSDLLTENFPDTINVGFTAQMEGQLDQIARGEREWVSLLEEFYHPFEKTLERAMSHIDKLELPDQPAGEICPNCGRPMVIKTGRYGKFIACSGYPQCKTTKPLVVKTGVSCPECGGNIIERRSKKGRRFYGCSNFPRCQFATNQRPLPYPCPLCGSLLLAQGNKMAKCFKCGGKFSLQEIEKSAVSTIA